MAIEPEIMKVSSDEFDKHPERYRVQATPGHIVQVIEPSGGTTVIMSEQDFEGYKATIVLLSNPHDAQALKDALAEAGPTAE